VQNDEFWYKNAEKCVRSKNMDQLLAGFSLQNSVYTLRSQFEAAKGVFSLIFAWVSPNSHFSKTCDTCK